MREITGLVGKLFRTRWTCLHGDGWDDDAALRNPGVYLLAYSQGRLADQPVQLDDVHYVGMSNSQGGVRARLNQFKAALECGRGHSAGDYCYKQNGGRAFTAIRSRRKFYFASWCIDVPRRPDLNLSDLKKLGQVACLEYYAIAHIKAKSTNRAIPPLNRSTGGAFQSIKL